MKLIYSGEKKFLYDAIQEHKKKNSKIYFWDESITDEENLDAIELTIGQSSMFDTPENYLFINIPLFKKSKKKQCEKFIDILLNSGLETIVTVNDEKIEIPEWMDSKINQLMIPKLSWKNINQYIEGKLKDYNVQYNAKQFAILKNKLGNDPWIIENEIKKLSMYGNVLEDKAIDQLVIDYSEQNIFKMIDWILKGKNDLAILSFDEICPDTKSVEEVISIMVGYLFKLKVMFIYQKNNRYSSLKNEFKIFDFQEKEYLSLMQLVSIDKINELINNLVKLDKGIKQGAYDSYTKIRLLIAGGMNGF